MKLVESKLRKLIREEIQRLNEKIEGGQSAGTLEIASTKPDTARAFAKKKGWDISEITNFDKNFNFAAKKASLGKTKRKDMPVINDNDVKEFQRKLEKGYIDVVKPFSKTFSGKNPFPSGLKGGEARDFLERGLKDGEKSDDVISVSIRQVSAKKLKPIQKQIYFSKIVEPMKKFGVKGSTKFLVSQTFFIASEDLYIIDGHHRWLSALLMNPDMKVNVLTIDLPIRKLLPLSIAYGDSIGNSRNG
jgi:hypothetical protein